MAAQAENRWQRLRELFEEASTLSVCDQDDFVERECGSDQRLRADLGGLLARHREAEDPIRKLVDTASRGVRKVRDRSLLQLGQKVGKYRILSELGEGGMGRVFAAEDLDLGRRVALKVLTGWRTLDPESTERLRQEARILASLNHPNIVTIHAIEHEDDLDFLVMELVEGIAVNTVLPAGGLSLKDFFTIAIPLLDAVSAAHEKGVIHRDLKPANIMLGENRVVSVLDFGLAKLKSGDEGAKSPTRGSTAMTRAGLVIGTVPYMSPEQIEGKAVDFRTDIFSLGVVLYELATGTRPFRKESVAASISSTLRDNPPSARRLRAELPPRLALIIHRCLQKNPGHRYQDTKSMARDLEELREAIESHPTISRSLSKVLALLPIPARWRLRELIPAAATIVMLLVLGQGFWTRRMADSIEPQRIESLAILPLVNLSGDQSQEYLADGMTEILTAELSKVEALRVVSRTSAMRFSESELGVPEIAATLGVDAVVEGSVSYSEDQLRVITQLIRAESEDLLWTGSFEGQLEDFLPLQSQAARALIREVGVDMRNGELLQLHQSGSVNAQAAEAFLRGLKALGRNELDKALAYFEKAIAAEPEFARAHLQIAQILQVRMATGYLRVSPALARCREALARALEIDPELADAHRIKGWLALTIDWDWAQAEEAFERAIELSPGMANAHQGLADLMIIMGRTEEGLAAARHAWERKPLADFSDLTFANQLYLGRQFDDAISNLGRQPDIDAPAVHWMMSLVAQAKGDEKSAVWFDFAYRKSFDKPQLVLEDLEAAFKSGTPEDYWRAASRHFVRWPAELAPAAEFARVYVNLGETEKALDWLERAVEERQARMRALAVDPGWDSLRSEPRFQMLLDRLGLPQI